MKLAKDKIFNNIFLSAVFAVVCCLLWGSAFPCIKIGYGLFKIDGKDYFAQIIFAGIRFLFAGVLVLIFGSIGGKHILVPKKSSWGYIVILTLTQTVVQYVFFYIGLANTSGVNGSILNGSGSLFVILIACLLRQEKFNLKKIIGCILGFGGVIFASLSQGKTGDFSFLGEGFILLSALSYGFNGVFIKKFSEKENPITLTGYSFVIGGAIMIIIGFSCGGKINSVNVGGLFLLFYLAFLSAVAYSLWSFLLKNNPVSKIAVYGFIIPIAGSLMSALFLKEYNLFNYKLLIALTLVALGIFIVNFIPKKRILHKDSEKNNEIF